MATRFPRMARVRQRFEELRLEGVEGEVRRQVARLGLSLAPVRGAPLRVQYDPGGPPLVRGCPARDPSRGALGGANSATPSRGIIARAFCPE